MQLIYINQKTKAYKIFRLDMAKEQHFTITIFPLISIQKNILKTYVYTINNFIKMNTSNLIELMSQNKKYESHRKKISHIMTKSTHSLSFRRNDSLSQFHSSRDKANRYINKMKQQVVDKQNDLILKKIIDVNRRSHSNSTQLNTSFKREISHNNLSNLKKQLEKTNLENQKIASKLVTTTSKLNQNLMSEENRKYNEIKQRIKKYTFDIETGMVVPKKIKSLVKMGRLDPIYKDETSRKINEQYE